MSDEEDEQDAHEFLVDAATRMVEMMTHSAIGNTYIAYTLGGVLDSIVSVPQDDPAREFAEDMIMDILKTLTYVQVKPVLTEQDIEDQAQQLRAMLDHADKLGKKNEENEEEQN